MGADENISKGKKKSRHQMLLVISSKSFRKRGIEGTRQSIKVFAELKESKVAGACFLFIFQANKKKTF